MPLGIRGRLYLRFQRNGEKQDLLRSSSNRRIPGYIGSCCQGLRSLLLKKAPRPPDFSSPALSCFPGVSVSQNAGAKGQGIRARVTSWRLYHAPVTTLDDLPVLSIGWGVIILLSSGLLWESVNLVTPRLCCACVCCTLPRTGRRYSLHRAGTNFYFYPWFLACTQQGGLTISTTH